MTPHRSQRIGRIAVCAIVGFFASATAARAQIDFGTPSQAEMLSTAAKASPELVEGLAKELGSTPEQAAGAAGVLFGIMKSFLKPEDFAEVAKAVPGMEALLAATPAPTDAVGTSGNLTALPGSTLSPGFASSSSSTPGMTMAAPDGMTSAVAGFSKLGISPEMIAKALPFLSGYSRNTAVRPSAPCLGVCSRLASEDSQGGDADTKPRKLEATKDARRLLGEACVTPSQEIFELPSCSSCLRGFFWTRRNSAP